MALTPEEEAEAARLLRLSAQHLRDATERAREEREAREAKARERDK